MSFLGIEAEKAPAGMRSRRFIAFLIDAGVIIAISFLFYKFTGQPDFFAVQDAMNAMDAAGGQDAALTAEFVSAFNRTYGLMILIALCYEDGRFNMCFCVSEVLSKSLRFSCFKVSRLLYAA